MIFFINFALTSLKLAPKEWIILRNSHFPRTSAQLVEIDQYLPKNFRNTYLAALGGHPEFETVKKTIKTNGSQRVKFATFMLSFGDHMSKDVMGDEADFMKNSLPSINLHPFWVYKKYKGGNTGYHNRLFL